MQRATVIVQASTRHSNDAQVLPNHIGPIISLTFWGATKTLILALFWVWLPDYLETDVNVGPQHNKETFLG